MHPFSNPRGAVRAMNRAARHLRPPPAMKPSEWSERNVRIPIGNAIPGFIRFDNAPYQREPLDMTANPSCRRITMMWGAQVGKTMTALCAQAYHIGQKPVSQIMMQPSQGDLHTWLETKFNPLVEENEALTRIIAKPRGRDGVNNQRMKSYPGGFLMFSWSGSPKTMRGRSAPFIVCDETDGYDMTHEGHPVSLLWQRAATFGDQRLLMEISTPTIKGESHIEAAFEQGDQRRFHVVCPHCEAHQWLKWGQVVWQKDEKGNHLPETATYACESCGASWSDGERMSAIRGAERDGAGWKAARPFRGHASYHLSELYSTLRRLSDIVQSFLDKKAINDLQTFVNVSLAETWEEVGEQADSESIAARAYDWGPKLPAGIAMLTAGVDMQQDRLELEIVGWGVGEESWSVDYRVLWGDPLRPDVWSRLDEVMDIEWPCEDEQTMRVTTACVDTGGTGGSTQAAYSELAQRQQRGILAIKGASTDGSGIVSHKPSEKRIAVNGVMTKLRLFSVYVGEAKKTMMRNLGVIDPGPGHCHFPAGRDAEYFAQLTAEKLVTRYRKGFPHREWHKTRPRNEALDARVYAYAALKLSGVDLVSVIRRRQGIVQQSIPSASPATRPAAPVRKRGFRREW